MRPLQNLMCHHKHKTGVIPANAHHYPEKILIFAGSPPWERGRPARNLPAGQDKLEQRLLFLFITSQLCVFGIYDAARAGRERSQQTALSFSDSFFEFKTTLSFEN